MTLRAILIGLLLTVLINVWTIYADFAVRSSLMTIAHIPIIVLMPLFLLTAAVNPLLARLRSCWRLSTPELFTIFAMGLIASTVPGFGFSNYFFRVITVPHYFASSENQWETLLFPHLPQWLVVTNQGNALTWYYEGLPEGQGIPWGAWTIPVFWWMTFVGALFLAGSCTIVLLRKQWVEHEKLTFPLAHIPLAMMQQDDRSVIPPYLRQRLFWVGFGIPVFIIGWNIIDYFTPIGVIPIGTSYQSNISLGRAIPALPIKINFLVLACAFFTNVEVLFSVWLFQGVATLLTGLLNQLGISYSASTLGLNSAMLSHYFGGFVVFVLWTLWTARRHLKAVLRHTVGRPSGLDDREELIPYRSAVIGLMVGVVYVVAWLHASGMAFWVAAVFLFALFVLYLGIARIVAETGLAYLDLPVNANEFTIGALGSGSLNPSTLVSLGLANVYARNWRFFSMSGLSHLIYIERTLGRERFRLYGTLCAAATVGMLTAVVWTIYMGYNPHHVTSFGSASEATGSGEGYIQIIVTWMKNATAISRPEQLFFIAGVVLAGGLIALRYLFPSWPIHPIGFAIAGSNVVRVVTFSIFLAWLVKLILLRLGGVSLYKKGQPIFIGMLAGYALSVVVSSVIDAIWFPGQGHVIHTW